MKCYTHPTVETNLSCGKCGKPICPKCMVQTPVGARCPECARLYRLPTYQVSTTYYLRAIGAGLGLAAVFGFLWGLVQEWLPMYFLNFVLAYGVGYATGEVMSHSVNRKRGMGLAVIAGASVVLSYLMVLVMRGGFPVLPFGLLPLRIVPLALDLFAVAIGVFVAVRSFVVR